MPTDMQSAHAEGFPFYRPQHRRGVAQPGRAPGSGPGGRRFKSSLPDQSFQALKLHFWFSVYIDGVEIVDVACFAGFPDVLLSRKQTTPAVNSASNFLTVLRRRFSSARRTTASEAVELIIR